MKRYKLYLKRTITLFLTSTLLDFFSSPSIARIPPLAFKDITHYFQPGQEFYSPTLGMAALESGLIYNLRFHGNFIAQYKLDEGNQKVRDYVKDVSGIPPSVQPDPLWTLVKLLFPSSGGDLATQTNSNNSFGKHVVSPHTIALLLNYAQQIRMTGHYISPIQEVFQDEKLRVDLGAEDKSNKALMLPKRESKIPETIPLPMELFLGYVKRSLITPTPEQLQQIETYKAFLENILQPPSSAEAEKSFKHNHQIFLTDKSQIEDYINLIQARKRKGVEKKIAHKKKENVRTPLMPLADHILKSLAVSSTTEKGNLKKNINNIVDNINKSIAQEKSTSFYPTYTTEQVVLAFFCEHFDTQENIFELLKSLAALDINHSLISNEKKMELKDASPNLLTEADLALIAKNPNPNIDDFYALANSDIFQRVMPYKSGEQPVSNGMTQAYDRHNNKIERLTVFADCVEVLLRHLLNLMIYDPIPRKFVLDYLELYVKSLDNKIITAHFQEIKSFFQNQVPLQANAGNVKIRSLWNRVVGDLNAIDGGNPYNILYHSGETYQYDMEPGFINIVNVLMTLFNLQLPPQQGEKLATLNLETATLIEKKEWIVAYLQVFFNLINPTRSYEFEANNLREGIQQGRLELFGDLNVQVKEKASEEKLFSFTLDLENGHGELTKLQDERANKKQYPLPNTTKMHLQVGTSLNSLKLLVPAMQQRLTEALYRLYPRILEDNESAVGSLKTLADLATQTPPGIDNNFISSILSNILDAISWDDLNTLNNVSPILLQLQQNFPDILKDHVEGFASYGMTNETLQKVLVDFPKIKFLYLTTSQQLEELSLSNLENLQFLSLQDSHLKKLTLENLNALEKLDLQSAPFLESLFLNGMTNETLQKVLVDFSKIKFLYLTTSQQLEELSLSNLENLQFLSLQGAYLKKLTLENLNALEKFDLQSAPLLEGLSLRGVERLTTLNLSNTLLSEIHGLENLKTLKSLKLRGTRNLQELFVAPLENLQALQLSNTYITKIHGLENLKTLRLLDLEKTINLQEVSVGALENLQKLNLLGSSVAQIHGLENLKTLRLLDLGYTKNLQEISLTNLTNLLFLSLEGSSVTKVQGLETLTALETLKLASTQFLQEFLVGNLVSLEELDLSRSSISKIHGLENLRALRKLNLQNTRNLKLKELSLNNCERLQDLFLMHSSVSKIEGLESLKDLRVLELSHTNNVQDLFLSNLDNLQYISLWGTSVQNIHLENLKSLKTLNAGYTENLQEIILRNMENVEEVSLLDSDVQKISLGKLKALKTLNLTNTDKIQELHLDNLENLQILDLSSAKNVQKLSMTNLNSLQVLELSSSWHSQLEVPLANLPPTLKVIRK